MISRFAVSAPRRRWQKGAVSIAYLAPFTSAPTGAQMNPGGAAGNSTVVATVAASAQGDTSVQITHAFNSPNSDITLGFPTVLITPTGDPTTANWFLASMNPNYAILQKATSGPAPNATVTIRRSIAVDR